MIYPNKPTVTEHPMSSWMNKTWNVLQGSKPIGGNGVSVQQTPNGFSISVRKAKSSAMYYAGDYNTTASYRVGQVVRVKTAAEYTDTVQTPGSSATVYSAPGVYVCVQSVPADIELTDFSGAPDYVYRFLQSIDRVEGQVYAPIFPEPTNRTYRYWEKLAFGTTESFICVDGVNTPYYVDAYQSGSSTG